MRKIIQAFCLFLCTALVTVQSVQASNPFAGGIFGTIGGNTTIDRGGALHSQARSIYSLGGGMTSFEGKKVSLLAVDPPGFSAGCNGISWHFGGFAFISLDEIRQLVEAVAQASLGIAVDLAMQTLCPQCYAVMAKLRDISNMMRNAAADSCKIAQNFGAMLKNSGIFTPHEAVSKCSETTTDAGKTASWMDAAAGQACKLLSSAQTTLSTEADSIMNTLKFGNTSGGNSTTRDKYESYGNVTYNALSALGYEDGVMKDVLLSLLGMTVIHPKPAQDCRKTFEKLYGSAESVPDVVSADITPEEKTALKLILVNGDASKVIPATPTSEAKFTDAATTPATVSAAGSSVGQTVCYAPPVLSGFEHLGLAIMCGFNRVDEATTFANNYFKGELGGLAGLKATSLGAMCLTLETKDNQNPLVYTCRKSDSGECLEPSMTRLNSLAPSTTKNGYTGLAWMIGDALQRGVQKVRDNTSKEALDPDTIAILNGSGWPLYRLINMAAVYPAMAGELLNAYTAAIAAQYTMDTLDKVARIGQQPSINMKSIAGLQPTDISYVREQIMNLVRAGNSSKTAVLDRLAEKRQMVEVIMQVNKTLQAEVIGQGLGGNTSLAVSIKRQSTNAKPNPPTGGTGTTSP
jgi:hypothetical protein